MSKPPRERPADASSLRRTRRALLAATAAASVGGAAGCLSITTPADLAAATTPRGQVEYFVGSPWLAERRRDYAVLDARPRAAHRQERIYGAQRVDLDDITRQRDGPDGLIPDVDAIASSFGDLGVTPDDDVVVYGQSVGARVTRVVFALMAIGHRGAVRILNGGLDGWNGRIGTGNAREPTPVSYDAVPDDSLWVTREWVADRVGSFNEDGPGLVDVRPSAAFLGASADPSPDLDRHGHVPGAVNVYWFGNIDGRSLADPGTLFHLYNQRAGLSTDVPVVVCGEGNVNATQTMITLRAIGFEDVRLYDGGFREWANVEADRGRYPIETKTGAVIETEGGPSEIESENFSCTG